MIDTDSSNTLERDDSYNAADSGTQSEGYNAQRVISNAVNNAPNGLQPLEHEQPPITKVQVGEENLDTNIVPSPSNAELSTPALPTIRRSESVDEVYSSQSSVQEVVVDNPPIPIIGSPPLVHNHERKSRIPSGTSNRSQLSISENTHSPNGHHRNLTISQGNTLSVVLISSALEIIASSKEARRSPALKESVNHALELVRAGEGGDKPKEIFEPLRLACETRNEKLMIASLDCISKLTSHSFFVQGDAAKVSGSPTSASPSHETVDVTIESTQSSQTLVDAVAHTITSCYTESSSDAVSLQIVKALLALVLSQTLLIHQSSLLKAIRTVYNIFLLSTDPVNQTVAQGGLTQMVNHIFSRCRLEGGRVQGTEDIDFSRRNSRNRSSLSFRRSSLQLSTPDSVLPPYTPLQNSDSEFTKEPIDADAAVDTNLKSTIVAYKTRDSFDDSLESQDHPEEKVQSIIHQSPPTAGPNVHAFETPDRQDSFAETEREIPYNVTTNDLFIKDAFLVFRALCKLTMKPLNNDSFSERDAKSHAMRSKLLSLHLVLLVLNSYMHVFVDPSSIIYSTSNTDTTSFLDATKQFLCLTVSRNSLSPIPQVFETSIEIFWRVLSGMRTKLKKEIEVFLHEIYIPILEMKSSTLRQKGVILSMLSRLCQEPQALVEIYLNYDCDKEAADNIYEHLMNVISKISTAHFPVSQQRNEPSSPAVATNAKGQSSSLPSLSTSALAVPVNNDNGLGVSTEQLRRQGLECLAAVLRSLVVWGTATRKVNVDVLAEATQLDLSGRVDGMISNPSLDNLAITNDIPQLASPDIMDDPGRFESAKQRKNTLLEGLKRFNSKPKRGIEFLIEHGFISSRSPLDIAKFLLHTDGLSKVRIGEYLGEGDEENVAIMHAFVDQLHFTSLPFVDALRLFLQSFRLPGESQKIDRFMLKFAERYIGGNNQTPFANADTAYVLSYSTIMLNTDAHNPQVKQHMTKADFMKILRGTNDGGDLPEDFLSDIYNDIVSNEIRMKDELETRLVLPAPASGIANALANVGRDLQKEAYVLQSHGMANKTEALLKTLMRTQRKGLKGNDQFFSASHFVHVRPMFEVAWIPFLAGLSGPLQDTDNMEIVELCLEGFKNAIKIGCFFDLELERNAFVTTLAKFTFLNNLGEMKAKNMEAIKALLDVAVTEGNQLRGSWLEVLTCVSQLERMQLISSGVDLHDSNRKGRAKKLPAEELANESRSTHITVAADMVFSLSHYLSGTAIVDFVKALSNVSWEEIQSSGLSEHPRLFSLQKLVEISYYNMGRIRLEWSNIWEILGEHFNQVCCHHNTHVGFFALDALRQLAMRFLEKEELPHFKFQKDFMKPFEYTMVHNTNPEVRDMVLQCLQQMIQARVQNMRSGWRTMFGVFSAASKVLTEKIVASSFEIVTRLNEEHFSAIIRYGSFADLTICITDFCKVSKYQKISLLAIAMLRGVIPKMLNCADCSLSEAYAADGTQQVSVDDSTIKYWFPCLFSFYDIIMNAEDLEIRRLALDSMFSTLKTYGHTFPVDFWDTVCRELLFPIFAVLKSSSDLSRWSTQEDMSVWLSTTMIQALRDLIGLYTYFFNTLERFLDGLLELLCVCICQESDTLARIGTSCLQQLLEKNVRKLTPSRWEQVATTFVRLFKTTTPHQLFDESLRIEVDETSGDVSESPDVTQQAILPAPLHSSDSSKSDMKVTQYERRRIFKQIIVKCVLQLLLIETTHELLQNQEIYSTIPPEHLLRLMGVLDHSYQFARVFNEDKELRTALWKVGFMKHLPNLLKQETSSAATLANVLLRMYFDARPGYQALRPQVAERLLPLGLGVIQDYNKLRSESHSKNITAWTPVVAEILHGFSRFDDKTFGRYLPALYTPSIELLAKDISTEIRLALRDYLLRVGKAQGIVEQL